MKSSQDFWSRRSDVPFNKDRVCSAQVQSAHKRRFCSGSRAKVWQIKQRIQRDFEFSERKAHNSNLYQLFMREPINGIKVELNFSWEEAANMGRVPKWTDTGENAEPAANITASKAVPAKA